MPLAALLPFGCLNAYGAFYKMTERIAIDEKRDWFPRYSFLGESPER
jgi:hypothetical protein